jgi:transcriptional regulator with XRE-family HTH domain
MEAQKISRQQEVHLSYGLSNNLKYLLKKKNLSITDLSRETGIPQPTITQLILGQSISPRITTLIPIATFFNITIDELIGIKNLIQPSSGVVRYAIPILDWENIYKWINDNDKFITENFNHWIATEKILGTNAFALFSTRTMEPLFRHKSILLIDTKANITDGSYVIYCDDSKLCNIKRTLKDGAEIYLESISIHNKETIKYNLSENKIYGVVVESRLLLN